MLSYVNSKNKLQQPHPKNNCLSQPWSYNFLLMFCSLEDCHSVQLGPEGRTFQCRDLATIENWTYSSFILSSFNHCYHYYHTIRFRSIVINCTSAVVHAHWTQDEEDPVSLLRSVGNENLIVRQLNINGLSNKYIRGGRLRHTKHP